MQTAEVGPVFGWIYLALLASAVLFVLARGAWEERIVIAALLGGSFITGFLDKGGVNFGQLSPQLIANELWVLALILIVAYRSHRFWPLSVASLEIAALLSLLTPLFGRNLVSYALGVAQGLWAYPQLLIVFLAVVRGHNKSRSLPT